jgi:hypothetical protein
MKALANISSLNSAYLFQLEKHRIDPDKQLQLLNQFLLKHNCTFSGKPMPTLLKPYFVSKKQLQKLKLTVEVMSSALDKFIDLYMENEDEILRA